MSGNAITGTLANISDGTVWDAGTWSADESTGHYIFLKASNIPEGATATVELVGGVHGPVTLDEDLNIILRVTDPSSQSVKLTVAADGQSYSKTYTLTGVTLASD